MKPRVSMDGGAARVRLCRARDREALVAIGSAPGAAAILAPGWGLRLRMFVRGDVAAGFVAEQPPHGPLVGAAHFVRSRIDPAVWVFGHWRVAPARRRAGIGRLLVREGVRALGIGRLYSYVDLDNDGSFAAHERLGFAAAPELAGVAPLGALTTLGPPAPAVRLEAVRGAAARELAGLYRRSMGVLWQRLFPGDDGSLDRDPVFRVDAEGATAALVRRRRLSYAVHVDPSFCGPGLLARIAARIAALGVPRDTEIELRGVPRAVVGRGGPISASYLMALPDATLLER